MAGTTKRLFHFTCTKWALTAIRDRRLKGAQLDNTNDVFDLLPFREDPQNSFQEYSRWRSAPDWIMLCLSATCTNPLLWGHYADKGKGMCLGFDVIVDRGRGSLVPAFIEVDYKTDRIKTGYEHPQLGGRLSLLNPSLAYGVVKNSGWEYEKEWRTWRRIEGEPQDPVTRLHYFPFDGGMTLREILVGPRCEDDDIKSRIERLTADYDPKPQISSTRLSSFDFRIERE